mmetsp:Transcript_87161/g.241678  ORF Transcript_87161/g.241678 Transcript_87161/m.241678 type:complete len:273 (+) Transcript_87161:79-897(+)
MLRATVPPPWSVKPSPAASPLGSGAGEGASLLRQLFDPGHLALRHGVAGDHPRTPARNHLRDGEVLSQGLLVDAASGHEFQTRVGRADGLQRRDPAVGLRREELHEGQAQTQGFLHLRWRGHTWDDRNAALLAPPHDLRVQPWRDDELGSGVDGLLRLRGREDRAGSAEGLRHTLGHALQCLLSGSGAEDNLDHREAAGHEGLSQGLGPLRTRHGHHGHHPDLLQLLEHRSILCGQRRVHCCGAFTAPSHRDTGACKGTRDSPGCSCTNQGR